MSKESRYILKLRLCGTKSDQLLVKIIVNLEDCADIDALIGQVCVKLAIPHVDQIEMTDEFGNVIESLGMLMQVVGEVILQINPLIKSKEYDPETGNLETKVV